MSGLTVVRVRVAGRVQGVGYRYWVVEQAAQLHLDGWVRNRRDGSVEAVFSGTQEAVANVVRRCRRGPVLARVDRVADTLETNPVAPGFQALPTA